MEPPFFSVSVAGSVIDPDINIEERKRIPEDENRGEMDPLQTYLEADSILRKRTYAKYPSPVLHQQVIEQQIPLLPTSGSDVGQQVKNAELKHHVIYHHSD